MQPQWREERTWGQHSSVVVQPNLLQEENLQLYFGIQSHILQIKVWLSFCKCTATGSFILREYYSPLFSLFFLFEAIHYRRDRVIKMIKYLQIFQTWPLQARRSTRTQLFAQLYSNDNILLLPNSPPSLSLLHEPGLSLVRIEYLYSVWLGSRSLISKVTCWASAGSAAVRGLAWDGVTWDILSPQCVLLFTDTVDYVFWRSAYAAHKGESQQAGYGRTTNEFIFKKKYMILLRRPLRCHVRVKPPDQPACKTNNERLWGCDDDVWRLELFSWNWGG